MQKIIPHLWFDDQAEQAARFYTSLFQNSRITDIMRYAKVAQEVSGMPAGSVMTVSFELAGFEVVGLNGGPAFKFTPAVSFLVSCDSHSEIDDLWQQLADGGTILMELDRYPFSEKFGWLEDRYGVSWQLMLVDRQQKITPFLMFVNEQQGRAEEAMKLYTSLFNNSAIVAIQRWEAGTDEPAGTVMHAIFSLDGEEFMAMDSAREHRFTFTPAISFLVRCETQAEVDRFWEALSKAGTIEQCGWLRDKFGVSWQIVPTILLDLLKDPDGRKVESVTKAMLGMKKLDINGLRGAAVA